MNADFTRWAAELAQDSGVAAVNCVCGHPREQHEHYRAGTDCVVCGCMSFRAPQSIGVTVAVGWLIILALTALVFIGAAWVGSHIIGWVTG